MAVESRITEPINKMMTIVDVLGDLNNFDIYSLTNDDIKKIQKIKYADKKIKLLSFRIEENAMIFTVLTKVFIGNYMSINIIDIPETKYYTEYKDDTVKLINKIINYLNDNKVNVFLDEMNEILVETFYEDPDSKNIVQENISLMYVITPNILNTIIIKGQSKTTNHTFNGYEKNRQEKKLSDEDFIKILNDNIQEFSVQTVEFRNTPLVKEDNVNKIPENIKLIPQNLNPQTKYLSLFSFLQNDTAIKEESESDSGSGSESDSESESD